MFYFALVVAGVMRALGVEQRAVLGVGWGSNYKWLRNSNANGENQIEEILY